MPDLDDQVSYQCSSVDRQRKVCKHKDVDWRCSLAESDRDQTSLDRGNVLDRDVGHRYAAR